MKIIFLGTPLFASIILERIADSEFKPFLVATEPDKKAGRNQILTPSAVKITAKKHNIETEQPERISDIKTKLASLNPDLIITAAYGQILPREILDIPSYGSLNIHPSLLPKYRGPSPIQAAILNLDKATGVSIILMDEKIDHGPIVSQRELEIKGSPDYQELESQLASLSSKLIIEAIPAWTNKEIKAQIQDESQASYTKIIKKEDGRIDWNNEAEKIEAKVRAFSSWPRAFALFEGKRLNILKAKVLPNNKDFGIGKTITDSDKLLVKCSQGWLEIEELQLEGRKPMSSAEFLKGHKISQLC